MKNVAHAHTTTAHAASETKGKITLNSEFAQTNEKLCMVFYRHRQ